jgi:hypothetical protein
LLKHSAVIAADSGDLSHETASPREFLAATAFGGASTTRISSAFSATGVFTFSERDCFRPSLLVQVVNTLTLSSLGRVLLAGGEGVATALFGGGDNGAFGDATFCCLA